MCIFLVVVFGLVYHHCRCQLRSFSFSSVGVGCSEKKKIYIYFLFDFDFAGFLTRLQWIEHSHGHIPYIMYTYRYTVNMLVRSTQCLFRTKLKTDCFSVYFWFLHTDNGINGGKQNGQRIKKHFSRWLKMWYSKHVKKKIKWKKTTCWLKWMYVHFRLHIHFGAWNFDCCSLCWLLAQRFTLLFFFFFLFIDRLMEFIGHFFFLFLSSWNFVDEEEERSYKQY